MFSPENLKKQLEILVVHVFRGLSFSKPNTYFSIPPKKELQSVTHEE